MTGRNLRKGLMKGYRQNLCGYVVLDTSASAVPKPNQNSLPFK